MCRICDDLLWDRFQFLPTPGSPRLLATTTASPRPQDCTSLRTEPPGTTPSPTPRLTRLLHRTPAPAASPIASPPPCLLPPGAPPSPPPLLPSSSTCSSSPSLPRSHRLMVLSSPLTGWCLEGGRQTTEENGHWSTCIGLVSGSKSEGIHYVVASAYIMFDHCLFQRHLNLVNFRSCCYNHNYGG